MNDLNITNPCINFLCSLPCDSIPEFSSKISEYVNAHSDNEPMLLYVLENSKNTDLRFNAFYTLTVMYRKQKNVTKSERLATQYNNLFKNKPLFLYQMSNIHKNRMTYSDAILSIDYAKKAIAAIELVTKQYPGFYQNMADAIALSFENHLITDQSLLEEGLSCISHAITIDPRYAKYYCTMGRLLILKKNYSEARKIILHAIDIENSAREDFSLRISEYQDVLLKCTVAEKMDSIDSSLVSFEHSKDKLQGDLDRIRNSIIEFVGFFAAIIALVLTSVQIAINLDIEDSIRLVGFMIGGIIISFGCLRLVISFNKKAIGQAVVMTFIGLTFVGVSFLVVKFLL